MTDKTARRIAVSKDVAVTDETARAAEEVHEEAKARADALRDAVRTLHDEYTRLAAQLQELYLELSDRLTSARPQVEQKKAKRTRKKTRK